MLDEVRSDLPGLEAVVYLGSSTWEAWRARRLLSARRRGATAGVLAWRSAPGPASSHSTTRSTSSTRRARPGFPKGATLSHHNILNNGFFVGELLRLHRADRVCIPVPFYHCFGMVIGNLAAMTHGACIVIPGPGVRPARDPSSRARTSGALRSTASRRCSSPSSRLTIFARLRPFVASHRDHGRVALSRRGHEAGRVRDAHGRGDHLLRDDRDLARLDADPGRRRHRAPRLAPSAPFIPTSR